MIHYKINQSFFVLLVSCFLLINSASTAKSLSQVVVSAREKEIKLLQDQVRETQNQVFKNALTRPEYNAWLKIFKTSDSFIKKHDRSLLVWNGQIETINNDFINVLRNDVKDFNKLTPKDKEKVSNDYDAITSKLNDIKNKSDALALRLNDNDDIFVKFIEFLAERTSLAIEHTLSELHKLYDRKIKSKK